MTVFVEVDTTEGKFTLELDEARTPKTCENFLAYVTKGFYENTLFHRVIKNFVAQGGGFDADMMQKTTDDPIENEADLGAKNLRGSIAMARTSDPHSATSQFFINLKDNQFLDFKSKDQNGWGYCVFGRVINGMDVVDKIATQPTTHRDGHADVPEKDVLIKKMTVRDISTMDEVKID